MKKTKRGKFLETVKNMLRRLLRKSDPPGDPYAYRLAPVQRGPKGRSGAAVAELEEDSYGLFPPRRQ